MKKLLFFASAILFTACGYVPEKIIPPAEYIGTWSGKAKTDVSWVGKDSIKVFVKIDSLGNISGKLGDAELKEIALIREGNKYLTLKNPKYRIEASLEGPIIRTENIQRRSATIFFIPNGNKMFCEMQTSGDNSGNPERGILKAIDGELIRK